jgi:hypothetical protein
MFASHWIVSLVCVCAMAALQLVPALRQQIRAADQVSSQQIRSADQVSRSGQQPALQSACSSSMSAVSSTKTRQQTGEYHWNAYQNTSSASG